jgi:hypothetical protein
MLGGGNSYGQLGVSTSSSFAKRSVQTPAFYGLDIAGPDNFSSRVIPV